MIDYKIKRMTLRGIEYYVAIAALHGEIWHQSTHMSRAGAVTALMTFARELDK